MGRIKKKITKKLMREVGEIVSQKLREQNMYKQIMGDLKIRIL